MNRIDLSRPNPAQCIHHGARIDPVALAVAGIVVVTCRRGQPPLVAVAEALRFPAYYGRNWDALEECLLDLNDWWSTPRSQHAVTGWVLTADDAADHEWRRLDAVWIRAATVHAAAGRALHLVYEARSAKG